MTQHCDTKKNLLMAWPLALNALLMQSMLMIDTLLVSPLGEIPLAAMGIATTIIAFIIGVQLALSNGTQLIIGRTLGTQNKDDLFMALMAGIVINLLTALLFISLLMLWGDKLTFALSGTPEIAEQVIEYLSISQYLIIVNGITQSLTAFFNGTGDTKTPFRGYVLELPLNTVISYVLIFGIVEHSYLFESLKSIGLSNALSFQGMGLKGAALGSLLAIVVRLLYLGYQLFSSSLHDFYLRDIKCEITIFMVECREHFREISPIAANFILLSIGNTTYLLLYSQLDVYSFVAVTLIFPWMRIGTQFINAWAQASAILISQLIGHGEYARLKSLSENSIKIGYIMALVVACLFYALSFLMPYIYPNVTPDTYTALAAIVPCYVLLPMVRTYNVIAGNSLRAMGYSVQVLKIHFYSQWLLMLPLCALMVLYFELSLVWCFALIPLEEVVKFVPFYRLLSQAKLKLIHQKNIT